MKKVGILVVAYNAAATLARVLDRIPREFVPHVSEILVSDDSSGDSTYLVGVGYQHTSRDLPLTIVRQPRNLGYGGNQKVGYQWAIEQGLDIVVMLHGDGQYAPEHLPRMVEPLEHDKADAVFGSRMLETGAARRGGMPLYKYVGNRILSTTQNVLAGARLSEWHSGYRAYSVAALRDIPFRDLSDGFDFDTQIILELLAAGKRIEEVPIPTYYGDEICYVNGMRYAKDVMRHTVRHRARQLGLGSDAQADDSPYELKLSPDTSHGRIAKWLSTREPLRILDLGCSDGVLGANLRAYGHEVVGVDSVEHEKAAERLDAYFVADLDAGVPEGVEGTFDVVLAADVLEHLRAPERLLQQLLPRLNPAGSVIVSIPNFAHWYPRLRVVSGRFDYDRRGILDRTHLRFYTRRSFERLIEQTGYDVRRLEAIGLPLEVLERGSGERLDTQARVATGVQRVDKVGVALMPNLFAYQYLLELVPAAEDGPAPVIPGRADDGTAASPTALPADVR